MKISRWQNTSDVSKYPFTDSSAIDIQPFIDVQIISNAVESTYSLVSLAPFGTGIQGKIFNDATNEILSFQCPLGGYGPVLNSNGIQCGMVLSSKASIAIPESGYSWSAGTVEFDPSCIVQINTDISSLTCGGTRCVGDLQLIEGDGIKMTVPSPGVLQISAIGVNGNQSDCRPDLVNGALKTLSGLTPDSRGNFQFSEQYYHEPQSESDQRQILRITPGAGSLTFSCAPA